LTFIGPRISWRYENIARLKLFYAKQEIIKHLPHKYWKTSLLNNKFWHIIKFFSNASKSITALKSKSLKKSFEIFTVTKGST
jgi:hypothetical protein